MSQPLRILMVEDSTSDAQLTEREFRRGGFDVQSRQVCTAAELTEALTTTLWDIILCDHSMPSFDSAAALRLAKLHQPDVPFIIVSGSLPEAVAAKAMLLGAQDFLSKDNLARLVPAIKRELQDAAERRARHQAEQALSAQAEEMRIGREIQQRLFPATAPIIPGFDLAGASYPATATGGDYFDFIPMLNERIGVVVGDVTGHGLGPALIMADARAYLRTLAHSFSNVRDILLHANELLRADIGWDRFISVFFGMLCPTDHAFTFLNAGHPSGFLMDRTGQIKAELAASLPALGMFPIEAAPEPVTLALDPGNLLLLLTDGVTEATAPSGEQFGLERTLDLVQACRAQSADEVIRTLFATVQDFTQNQPQADDITMVVVKVTA